MNTIIKLLLLFIFVLTSKLNAQEEFTNLNCYNNKKSNLLRWAGVIDVVVVSS